MKTEQEIVHIINEYEKKNPCICGTDTLIKFIQWYSEKQKQIIDNANIQIHKDFEKYKESPTINHFIDLFYKDIMAQL